MRIGSVATREVIGPSRAARSDFSQKLTGPDRPDGGGCPARSGPIYLNSKLTGPARAGPISKEKGSWQNMEKPKCTTRHPLVCNIFTLHVSGHVCIYISASGDSKKNILLLFRKVLILARKKRAAWLGLAWLDPIQHPH